MLRLSALRGVVTLSLSLSVCTVSGVREKFFKQLAAGALQGVATQVLPPQMQAQMGLQPGAPGFPQQQPQQQQPQQPEIPPVDIARAEKLASMQKLLDRKLQQSDELRAKLDQELNFMKDEGLLESKTSTSALQAHKAAPGKAGAVGGMLPDLAAPIIFLEPPPVTVSQSLEAAEVAEATLSQLGDISSPTMKAVRDYELKKLGAIAGTTLQQIRKEISETEAAIEKRKAEREKLYTMLKEDGRELAKTGDKRLEMEATFANADLKEKSRELDILADKLKQLKVRERDLIEKEGPGTEAKEELEKEEGDEAQLADEIEEGREEE